MTRDSPLDTEGVTDAQRFFYETNGYLVLRNVLTEAEIGRLREAADRSENVWRADPSRPGLREPNISQVANILEYDDLFVDLLTHESMFPVVRDLIGPDIALISSDYYLMAGQSESDRGWHRDANHHGVYHPLSTMLMKLTVVLYDESDTRAPTGIIPGSHKFGGELRLPSVARVEDMPGQVRLLPSAGDAWLLNARCFHAALPNRTDDPRRILIYDFGHSWMKPRRDCKPSARLQALATTEMLQQLLHVES